jgi:hypothetical protein
MEVAVHMVVAGLAHMEVAVHMVVAGLVHMRAVYIGLEAVHTAAAVVLVLHKGYLDRSSYICIPSVISANANYTSFWLSRL